ncbi:MAG TPA: hypothetical protein VNL17_05975 [Verrucomicrobiae bacterium]|nr:hypothetical protein [Verrucomicrobiae bacterium]
MWQRFQRTWVVAVAILLAHRLVWAESPSNSLPAPLQQSDACVRRLHEIYDGAVRLEEKTSPEQAALADCVRSRALKIKGLLDLTEATQKDIQKAVRAAESDKAMDYLDSVKISCARAEKLLLEAEECATTLALKTAPAKDAPAIATNANVTIEVRIPLRPPSPSVNRRFVERTARTCLHHEQFAVLLARAMDLKLDPHATPEDCSKMLAKLAIEPLGGWRPGKCVTVDNVYVACARAMNLKVKDPEDPLSYGQALRDEGLGVDTILPERDPKLDPPLVVDSEVRAFLTSGYAAPLPSAKRVAPD